ncbi:MAG TPA: DUF2652 domain-containing protein [Candidatus Limnocylindrales bacterium]
MLRAEPCVLLIADISGYTGYLAGVEIDHAHDILADLIGTVVTALRPGFTLAKLEGDAAFCWAPAETDAEGTPAVDGSQLLDTIEHCYFGFRRRRRDVRQATSCECNACLRIPDLNLKFVAHLGPVLRQQVAGSEELLGSDVVLVHRLLKNGIVAATGIEAYTALSEPLMLRSGLLPEELGMRRHSEQYEHLGTVGLWVHDLEARWQVEDTRQRVFVSAERAALELVDEIAAPPQVIWEYITQPGRRLRWQANLGVTGLDQQPAAGGRRGVGMTNHCLHGPDVQIEQILDWRPFDYFTDQNRIPGVPTFLSTFELEPTTTGTRVAMRFAPADEADRELLMRIGGPLRERLVAAAADLKAFAAAEAAQLEAERAAEPALPQASPNGVLAGLEPA